MEIVRSSPPAVFDTDHPGPAPSFDTRRLPIRAGLPAESCEAALALLSAPLGAPPRPDDLREMVSFPTEANTEFHRGCRCRPEYRPIGRPLPARAAHNRHCRASCGHRCDAAGRVEPGQNRVP